MVSVMALLVVGVAGAAVHENEADNAVASALDDPETAAPAGSAPTSTPVTTTVTTSPSTSTTATTTAGFAPETLAGPAGPAGAAASGSAGSAGVASPAASSDAAGNTASGSAPAAAGNGEIASVGPPLADTGSYPLAVLGALLLALGGTGRALLRSASRTTV